MKVPIQLIHSIQYIAFLVVIRCRFLVEFCTLAPIKNNMDCQTWNSKQYFTLLYGRKSRMIGS